MTDISAFSLRPGQNFTWNIQGPPLKAPISRKAQWTPELVRQRGWCGWFGQKCFSFEKKFTFILRRYIRLWWLMSIVFKMLLQWHHHHVFHTVGQADVRRNHLSGLRCHSSRVPWLSWGLALISCKLSHLWWYNIIRFSKHCFDCSFQDDTYPTTSIKLALYRQE